MFEYTGYGTIIIKHTHTKIKVSVKLVYSNYPIYYISSDKYDYPERFWDWVTRIKDTISLLPSFLPAFSFNNINIRRFLNVRSL